MVYGEWQGAGKDPNTNVLTREVLPRVLRDEDPIRPYLPSSPYIGRNAFDGGSKCLPEDHLWGPRDYYKSDFYKKSLCHFVTEIGYHGCPSPDSVREFISPDELWPYQDNEQWLLHSTSPIPGVDLYDYRVELMAKQVRKLFGQVPDNLDDYAFASQASQAEALKFFIELFRSEKWRRTGIIWWNLIDGWPQFSDAIVDYYFRKKLAYQFVRRSQMPLCLMLTEPDNGKHQLVATNDFRQDIELEYCLSVIGTGEILRSGAACAAGGSVTSLGSISASDEAQRFYVIEWKSAKSVGINHYLSGEPPFDLGVYRKWLEAFEMKVSSPDC